MKLFVDVIILVGLMFFFLCGLVKAIGCVIAIEPRDVFVEECMRINELYKFISDLLTRDDSYIASVDLFPTCNVHFGTRDEAVDYLVKRIDHALQYADVKITKRKQDMQVVNLKVKLGLLKFELTDLKERHYE